MPDDYLIEEIPLQTADELLEHLTQSKLKNPRRSEGMLYRGHADAAWRLIPSALRGSTAYKWLTDAERTDIDPIDEALPYIQEIAVEVEVLLEFFFESDRQGLRLPEDGLEVREAFYEVQETLDSDFSHNTTPDRIRTVWPHPRLVSLMALAQHHRIPTRLLDWSWNPFSAAYFAAMDSLTATEKYPCLAVWSLDIERVEDTERQYIGSRSHWPVQLITVATNDNPNLRAQQGAFTLHNKVERGKGRFYWTEPSLDDVIQKITPESEKLDLNHVLTRITIPSVENRNLVKRLRGLGHHTASFFPGYDGVVRHMREKKIYS